MKLFKKTLYVVNLPGPYLIYRVNYGESKKVEKTPKSNLCINLNSFRGFNLQNTKIRYPKENIILTALHIRSDV